MTQMVNDLEILFLNKRVCMDEFNVIKSFEPIEDLNTTSSSETSETFETISFTVQTIKKENHRLQKDNQNLQNKVDRLMKDNIQMRQLILALAQKNLTPDVYDQIFQCLRVSITSSLQSNITDLLTTCVDQSLETTKQSLFPDSARYRFSPSLQKMYSSVDNVDERTLSYRSKNSEEFYDYYEDDHDTEKNLLSARKPKSDPTKIDILHRKGRTRISGKGKHSSKHGSKSPKHSINRAPSPTTSEPLFNQIRSAVHLDLSPQLLRRRARSQASSGNGSLENLSPSKLTFDR